VSSWAAKGVRQGAVFDIRQEDTEGRYRLVLTGELDMAGADKLEAAITRLCTAGALEIELDLRQLTFIDSQGLRAILAARETCADHHAEYFLIRGDHPAQQRLFEVTGLLDVLPWRQPGHEPS
jgi:anti-anti-sigma factor